MEFKKGDIVQYDPPSEHHGYRPMVGSVGLVDHQSAGDRFYTFVHWITVAKPNQFAERGVHEQWQTNNFRKLGELWSSAKEIL